MMHTDFDFLSDFTAADGMGCDLLGFGIYLYWFAADSFFCCIDVFEMLQCFLYSFIPP
jgi:hypothetical protein